MYVLGTAGHVDHGKSSLLRVLTGMEPDRLPEERKRGMTIDLNFVWLPLEDGHRLGIVDVPGHKRFVKNMISGVVNVDAFLFVVAADDGWMPQSEEHLSVLKHFGITHGIGILTKVDLVSEARAAEVEKDFKERLADAFNHPVPVVRFAAPMKEAGEVKRALQSLVKSLPPVVEDRPARLWIDRVFVPKGLGVVVTGTLREGRIKVGDAVTLTPGDQRAMVRSLQCYHEEVAEARPNTRLAIQLAGLRRKDVSRGQLMQSGEKPQTVQACEGELALLGRLPSRTTHVSFYLGTLHEPALLVRLKTQTRVRIKFERPLPIRLGDPFLIRTIGEERTLAAGKVVSLIEKKKKVPAPKAPAPVVKVLDAAESAREASVLQTLSKAGAEPMLIKDLEKKQTLGRLSSEGKIIKLKEDHYLLPPQFDLHRKKVEAYLRQKGKAGTPELKTLLGLSRKPSILILEKLDELRVTYLKDNVRKLLKG